MKAVNSNENQRDQRLCLFYAKVWKISVILSYLVMQADLKAPSITLRGKTNEFISPYIVPLPTVIF